MIDVDTGNDIAAFDVENFPDLKATDISSAYFCVVFYIINALNCPVRHFFNRPFTSRFRKLN